MPSASIEPANDPVSRAIARSALIAGGKPVPLVATAYNIDIRGGLADVLAVRTFRNDEPRSIEATLTFPMPVHAALYSLHARIAGRTIRAVARVKSAARQTYEDALERGKTTILHEELLKGVHLLSVGHIAPGAEIVVTVRFAVALARVGERTLLTIPTTVGAIYGNSGLPDCDELEHGGAAQDGEITVAADSGDIVLLGGELVGGRARVPLDAPIRIEVKGWRPTALRGRAADGRGVTLAIEPAPCGTAAVCAAVVIDRSGSMGELCAADAGLSKHAATLLGLSEAYAELRAGDDLHLWEFNDEVRDLGRTAANGWREQIRQLSGPHGGTEIGKALAAVTAFGARDIILVTDGKSYALDVAKLARSGARFTVVLIGEDSLEANIGHLATLTGGEIFVPSGANVADAVRSAVRAMRRPAGDPREANLRRSGMLMRASWTPDLSTPAADAGIGSRAVAAYAATLLLPSLEERQAGILAEMEGLVTHLTSLVLVDEEAGAQPGLAATRKVALPSPRTSSGRVFSYSRDLAARACGAPRRRARAMRSVLGERDGDEDARRPEPSARQALDAVPADLALSAIAAGMDWGALAEDVGCATHLHLDQTQRESIEQAAALPSVRRSASELGIAPIVLVLALMARFMATRDRHAARIARARLGGVPSRVLVRLARQLGLVEHEKTTS